MEGAGDRSFSVSSSKTEKTTLFGKLIEYDQ